MTPSWTRLFPLIAALTLGADASAQTRVAFWPGGPSHGYGEHEFRAGARLLAEALRDAGLGIDASVWEDGWPEAAADPLSDIDALVVYMDGGERHPILPHLDALDRFAARGGGLVFLHYALEVPTGAPADALRRWIGGAYESGFSTNPIWTPSPALAEHAACAGVAPFQAPDEWYFNLRFADAPGPTPLLTATPDDDARENPVWPRRPNEHVLGARGRRETLAWVLERPDGGRGAGFTGGHYHWNWGNDAQRRFVLNLIAWSAGVPVPVEGVPSAPLGFSALAAEQDEGRPWLFFSEAETRERFGLAP